jgi:hypothetical protein
MDVTKVADIMHKLGWTVAEKLQRQWFDGVFDGGGEPDPLRWPNPDTTTVKMDWVLKFSRAKDVFDTIRGARLYRSPNAYNGIKKVALKYKYRDKNFSFGDLGFTKSFPKLHEEQINFARVDNPYSTDELLGALGRFNFYVLIQGCASEDGGPMWVKIDRIGIYVRDPYDFIGEQYLGYWREDPPDAASAPWDFGYKKLTNRDFRDYRRNHGVGRDYQIFSDVKVIELNQSEKRGFTIP